MPWRRYQSSPMGRSAGSLRRPLVYTGGCSRRSRASGISPAWRRAQIRSWRRTPSRYGSVPRCATHSSGSAMPSMLPTTRWPFTLAPVSPDERFWPARLRWRLRGAWLWPAFVLFTVADGVLLHLLPPVRLGFTREGMTLVFGVIVATFANLVLVGAVAPWLARRLAERPATTAAGTLGSVPHPVRRELVLDRVGTALLAAGLIGVLAAGLGSREVVVADTNATETNAKLVRDYVQRTQSPELRRNLET